MKGCTSSIISWKLDYKKKETKMKQENKVGECMRAWDHDKNIWKKWIDVIYIYIGSGMRMRKQDFEGLMIYENREKKTEREREYRD